jgi:hypothetical protein
MKAQRKGGRGQNGRTPISIIIAVLLLLGLAGRVRGDTVWLSGHHEIGDGDVYGEIYIYNDVTLDVLGGDIYKLEAFDMSLTDWHAGEMDRLYVHDESAVNIFGGILYTLEATQDSSVNIYAYDVAYDPSGGGYGNGWLEGRYWSDDSSFGFSLFSQDSYSHVNVVPEPSTFVLIAVGAIILRRPKYPQS